ncbi:MAG: hypothetical protein RLZZ540_316 [Bacteroidota bacterium]|jgi:glycosyltransferase involved in cell wall biosynthesis
MGNHLISIIVPCYNQSLYLNECLQSVLDQTYINWECIIINDGSSDNTEEVAQNWVKKDNRFKYFYKENEGLSSARNTGLDRVIGDYIQFLDSDDCLHPTKLNDSLSKIKDHTNQNIVVTNFKMFKDNVEDELKAFCLLDQEKLNFKDVLYSWDISLNIPIHCGIFSSSLFSSFRFPQELKAKEDWIMWLIFFQKNISTYFINDVLVYYRDHDKNMTKNFDFMLQNTIKALDYLEFVIPKTDYKSYLFYIISKRMTDCEILEKKVECLDKRVIQFKTSIAYRIEKKITKMLNRLGLLNQQ